MAENEYRVRAVTRYVVTHFLSDGKSGSCEGCGEFPNIDMADKVGRALSAADPGSTFVTIEERREPVAIFYAYTSEQAQRLMATFPDQSEGAPPHEPPPPPNT